MMPHPYRNAHMDGKTRLLPLPTSYFLPKCSSNVKQWYLMTKLSIHLT